MDRYQESEKHALEAEEQDKVSLAEERDTFLSNAQLSGFTEDQAWFMWLNVKNTS